jgi:hypothetical protein
MIPPNIRLLYYLSLNRPFPSDDEAFYHLAELNRYRRFGIWSLDKSWKALVDELFKEA